MDNFPQLTKAIVAKLNYVIFLKKSLITIVKNKNMKQLGVNLI